MSPAPWHLPLPQSCLTLKFLPPSRLPSIVFQAMLAWWLLLNRLATQSLASKAEVVAVKRGALGALACKNHELIFAEPISVNVSDTVGAGDSFDAGFLFGYLNGWNTQKSLQLACVWGAFYTKSGRDRWSANLGRSHREDWVVA